MLIVPNLETPLGPRDRAILEVFYSTGIRASELCNLTLNDLDLKNGELRVNKGKGRKDRLVPLGEVACDFLEIYLREAQPKLAASDQPLLFVSKSRRKLRTNNLHHLVRLYGKKPDLSKG